MLSTLMNIIFISIDYIDSNLKIFSHANTSFLPDHKHFVYTHIIILKYVPKSRMNTEQDS